MREISNALPGADLVRKGIRDLEAGNDTPEAMLVLVGAPRLRALGLDVTRFRRAEQPEYLLYDLLAADDPDSAHSRYNALIRRLVSFERAAECVSE